MRLLFAYFDFCNESHPDGYRGFKQCGLNFSRDYVYSISNDGQVYHLNRKPVPEAQRIDNGFWGDRIYNVTALVGDNGAGKTTLLHELIRNCTYDKCKTDSHFLLLIEKSEDCENKEQLTAYVDSRARFKSDFDGVYITVEYPVSMGYLKLMLLDNSLSVSDNELIMSIKNNYGIYNYHQVSDPYDQLYNESLIASMQYSANISSFGNAVYDATPLSFLDSHFKYETFQEMRFMFDSNNRDTLLDLKEEGYDIPFPKELRVMLNSYNLSSELKTFIGREYLDLISADYINELEDFLRRLDISYAHFLSINSIINFIIEVILNTKKKLGNAHNNTGDGTDKDTNEGKSGDDGEGKSEATGGDNNERTGTGTLEETNGEQIYDDDPAFKGLSSELRIIIKELRQSFDKIVDVIREVKASETDEMHTNPKSFFNTIIEKVSGEIDLQSKEAYLKFNEFIWDNESRFKKHFIPVNNRELIIGIKDHYGQKSDSSMELDELMITFLDYYRLIINNRNFLTFSWGLSSGENNLLRMFTKFRYLLGGPLTSRSQSLETENKPKGLFNQFAQGPSNACDSLLLLIDEADLTYHPEWQRNFVAILTAFLPKIFRDPYDINNGKSGCKDIQIIISTHSPLCWEISPKET